MLSYYGIKAVLYFQKEARLTMPFVKFTETGRSYAARASLSRTGMMSFNDGTHKRFNLGNYSYVILYFDPDTNRIGVEPTNDGTAEGAKKLRHRTTGADIAAKSFIDFWNIKIAQTTSYDVDEDKDAGLLAFDLNKGKQRKLRDKTSEAKPG